MKIETYDHSLVYDLVNHMRKKGMPDEMAGYLRFLLEDNIPMHIKVDGKLYSAPWRYWQDYVSTMDENVGKWACDLPSPQIRLEFASSKAVKVFIRQLRKIDRDLRE